MTRNNLLWAEVVRYPRTSEGLTPQRRRWTAPRAFDRLARAGIIFGGRRAASRLMGPAELVVASSGVSSCRQSPVGAPIASRAGKSREVGT